VLARNLLAQGVAAEPLTRFVSELNDRVVQRVLALISAAHAIDDIAFAWIALGSEGRREQTIATDQDNGIAFVPPEDTADVEPLRARLVAFAKAVNAALDRCGFPLCRGDIMAGNPRWCLSVDEWRTLFDDWLRNPVPQALLSASIFFDLRPIGATPPQVIALRDGLADAAPARKAFLQAMARNALETRPPLGWFGGLTGSGRGERPDAIDLKLHGARIFVDFNQNAPHKTVFAPWSVRAREMAPVSCGFAWPELDRIVPDELTVHTVPARLAADGDPWHDIDQHPQSLEPLLALARRDRDAGLPDAPWPPEYPKMPGEATRVAPSRARRRPEPSPTTQPEQP
jgi:hypothetical protein